MGFFSAHNATTADVLKAFARKVAFKLLFIMIGWIGIYFFTQLIRSGALALFNLLVGSLAGLVIGWTMAEDAVQDSGFTGVSLWLLLTVLGLIPVAIVEVVMAMMTHWQLDLPRWMCISAAIIMILVSVVWRASADE